MNKNHAVKITEIMRKQAARPMLRLLFPRVFTGIMFIVAYTERLERENTILKKYEAALVYATQYLSESAISEVRMMLDE